MKRTLICVLVLLGLLMSTAFADANEFPKNVEATESFRFDSLNVRFEANWPFGPPRAVTQDPARNLAFCSSGGGTYILDVSNPIVPNIVSERIHSKGKITDLHFCQSNQLLYLAYYIGFGEASGFEIWDVSDEQSPVKLGHYYNTDIEFVGIYVLNESLFAAVGYNGIRIYDVSDPSLPQEIGNCETPGCAYDVFVSGYFAYVADDASGMRVIDVSIPSNPSEIGFILLPGSSCDIMLSGNFAYVAASNAGLRIIDISAPTDPLEIGYYDPFYCIGIFIIEPYAYMACNLAGLRVLDISNPSNPQPVGHCMVDGSVLDVSGFGNCAFLANPSAKINIIDISDPSNLLEIATLTTPHRAWGDVFVRDSIAFITCTHSGLWIIDVSIGGIPYELGHIDTPGSAYGIFVLDSFGYVADSGEGLRIINISDPCNPQEIGYCDTPGNANAVFISGSYAYVADDWMGLRVIDVSLPFNPFEVGFYDTRNIAFDVYVAADYAYVADGGEGLKVIDISVPSNPIKVGQCNTWAANGVYVSNSYAYVADGMEGLKVIDVSDPSNPFIVGSCTPNGYAKDIFISGKFAYLVSGLWGGLYVIDISTPNMPAIVGYYNPADWPCGVFACSSYAYVSTGYAGLQILEFLEAGIEEEKAPIKCTTNLQILQNPVRNGQINLLLSLSHPENAEIGLYNQIGQRVKTFHFSGLKAGRNRLELDIKELTSGVYFIKVQNIANLPTIKLLIIK